MASDGGIFLALDHSIRRQIIRLLAQRRHTNASIREALHGDHDRGDVQGWLEDIKNAGLVAEWDGKKGHLLNMDPLRSAIAAISQLFVEDRDRTALNLIHDPVNKSILRALLASDLPEPDLEDLVTDAVHGEEEEDQETPLFQPNTSTPHTEEADFSMLDAMRSSVEDDSVWDRLFALERENVVRRVNDSDPNKATPRKWAINKKLLCNILLDLVGDPGLIELGTKPSARAASNLHNPRTSGANRK